MPLLVIWAGLPWQQIRAGVEAVPQTFVLPHVKEGENNREGMQAEGGGGFQEKEEYGGPEGPSIL